MALDKKYENIELVNQELIHLAQLGDVTALNKLLVNNEPVIRKFLFRKVHNDSEVDDLVQLSLIKLSRAVEGYKHERPLVNYVFHLTNQVFISFLRKKKEEYSLQEEPDDESYLTGSLDDDFIQEESMSDLKQKVKVALDGFKNKEMMQVMKMKLFEELTNTEIVERTGLSKIVVNVHINRGKNILQNILCETGK